MLVCKYEDYLNNFLLLNNIILKFMAKDLRVNIKILIWFIEYSELSK